MIKKIVIIGGGTSGWITTLNFLKFTDNPQIINISSNEIPIIGVGESTTGLLNQLINIRGSKVDINELDFLKNTGAIVENFIVDLLVGMFGDPPKDKFSKYIADRVETTRGSGTWGFAALGMLIAVPLYTVLKVILSEFFQHNRIVKELTKNM